MKIRVGAVSLGWSGKPLPQVFDELRAMGGQCVEINYHLERHHGLTPTSENISRIRAWAEAAGLQISAVSGYNDFAQTDSSALSAEVEQLMAACRLASELGVSIVRAFAGEPRPGITLETAWPMLVKGFQMAARQAEPLGITLAIENHGQLLNDGPSLARLVQEVGATSVRLTLDTGNFCNAGHTVAQAQADFEAVLPYVVNVHLKDGVWQGDRFQFVPAGEGELPLAAWITRLAGRGYAGALCSEYEGAGDFLEGTRRSVQYLSGLVARTTRNSKSLEEKK